MPVTLKQRTYIDSHGNPCSDDDPRKTRLIGAAGQTISNALAQELGLDDGALKKSRSARDKRYKGNTRDKGSQ